MYKGNVLKSIIILQLLILAVAFSATAKDKLLVGEKHRLTPTPGKNLVHYPCLTPRIVDRIQLPLEREKPWSLPKHALAANFLDTINILVLRFNFQYEDPDDPNTTGRGLMNLSTDSAAFYDSAGHYIDPPPHDSLYFDALMKALRIYYETVSNGKITLTWDIYPPAKDTEYVLPHTISHYGQCDFDSVVAGLERYFIDCVQLVDTVSPEIDFSKYKSIFLFHAGADRQNDIGFPPTCSDLFTGFISFGDSVAVDDSTKYIRTALILPETASQDNRATALNAVMAHEFGHQLGLVDLYNTHNFMSQLGDFALMDDNGFGTGIDFGFPGGNVFGTIPLYQSAWSRAYLGFDSVVDFRQGSDIRIVAAEVLSQGIKIARVPITEKEYYLIENRIVDIDGKPSYALVDSVTNVIQGPVDIDRHFNREYDFLMPGSGVLIYHVDEKVAGLDYNYDGVNNFDENDLQWSFDIYGNPVNKFITLVEADGIVNFGGYYRSGWGKPEDMFRDDRNHSFTPNTNPPTIDNTGNNTHIYITDITRAHDTTAQKPVLMDSVVLFNVETDRLVAGFPVRAGQPKYALSPIVDDLDGDGNKELIFASGKFLLAVTSDGKNFLREYTGCSSCPIYEDTAFASIRPGTPYPIPLFVKFDDDISAGPVTGKFPDDPDSTKLVAVGLDATGGFSNVNIYRLQDANNDGQADISGARGFMSVKGIPIAMTFGDKLYVLSDSGYVYEKDSLQRPEINVAYLNATKFQGVCRVGSGLIVMAGDETNTNLYDINNKFIQDSISLGGYYTLGPILVDINLDGIPEVVAASEDGNIILVSVNISGGGNPFSILKQVNTNYSFTVNPVAGDIDLDGYPDIIIGGTNTVYAFNRELYLKTSFPVEINDKYPDDYVISPPIAAGIENGGRPEIIFPTQIGNIYSFGPELSYGFPLSAGELGVGSPVFFNDTTGGKLGYLGADGWFYLWNVDEDRIFNFWPMGGADPSGSFDFKASKLPSLKKYSNLLPSKSFYNYPNPVVNGITTIRYFLGQDAKSVVLDFYDLSGKRVAEYNGPTNGGIDNEFVWNCNDITPGVYRCVINVDFNGNKQTAFTDIAIIK